MMRRVFADGGRWVLLAVAAAIAGSCASPVARRVPVAPEVQARCLGILRAGLRSEEFWPSIHAAEGLTLAGHGDEVRRALEPRLATEADDRRRCGIARELVRAGDRAKATVMLRILAKEDPHGHVHAAESLYKVGEIGDGKLLRRAMGETGNVKLQLMAAAALGRSGEDTAMRLLRERLDADDPTVRRIAAWVLARIGDRSDIPALRRNVARSKDALERCFAAHALAALGDAEGRRALLGNLRSDDASTRTYAAAFAGDAGIAEAIPALVALLGDSHLDARLRAAQSLLVLASPLDRRAGLRHPVDARRGGEGVGGGLR